MKTTLDLNDNLLADAKALAARQRTSLTRLIEEGLQLRLRSAGKAARTDVKRLLSGEWAPDQSGVKADDRRPARAYSGVLCTLHTGRTHQIRVHLSSRRHPLVADTLYGGLPALGMTRQALHAARLSFVHPITGKNLRFEAPLPDDMAQAWALLEASAQEAAQNSASGA